MLYRVDLFNPSGIKQAVLFPTDISYSRKVNSVGNLQFKINGNDTALQYLQDEAQIEVWYKNDENSIDWYCDFRGFFESITTTSTGTTSISTITAIEQIEMLSWRVNAFPANLTNYTSFTNVNAETIMKNVVSLNFSNDVNRYNFGIDTRISIATNLNRGNVISRGNSYKNVLEELQYLAVTGNLDFALNKTGANSWQFEVYPNQLGTDRTSTVLFALNRGNINNVQYSRNRINFKNTAIVAGNGQNESRYVIVRTGDDYPTFKREVFVDVSSTDVLEVQKKGDAALYDNRVKETLSFDVVQIPSSLYRKHYFLGDLVTVYYNTTAIVQKIDSVQVTISKNAESIKIVTVTQ